MYQYKSPCLKNREKIRLKKNLQSLINTWNINKTKLHKTEALELQKRGKKTNIFKEIMAEKLPKFGEHYYLTDPRDETNPKKDNHKLFNN